jgi:hypothetical protein
MLVSNIRKDGQLIGGRATAHDVYSITSSARSMIDGGMARPSALGSV